MDEQNQPFSGNETPVKSNINVVQVNDTNQPKRKKYYLFVLALGAVFLFVAYLFYKGYLASRQLSTPNIPNNNAEVKPVDVSANEKNKLTNSKLLAEALRSKESGYVFPEFKIKDTGELKGDVDYIKVFLDLGAKVVSIKSLEYTSNKLGIFAELEFDNLDIKNIKVVVKERFDAFSWKINKGTSSDTTVFFEAEKDGVLVQVSQYLENGLQKIIIQSIEQK